MAGNHVLLETISLTQSAASVTFDNIPQTGYTDLKVVISVRSNKATGDGCRIVLNGATTGYSYKQLYGFSGGAGSTGSASDYIGFNLNAANSTASTFTSTEIYIPNAFGSNYKSISIDEAYDNNSTSIWQLDMFAGLWSSTAAITTLKLESTGGAFVQYSTFSLYGVADVNTTPVTAPLATGGNIVANDGTYWYHAFLTSGTFTPQTDLTCDALLVAGGGAGGWDIQGGGGAGGVVASNSAFAITTPQTVTIGAGGTGGTYSTVAYTSGSDTVFNSWTALGGGKGNSTGGSGGGGAAAGTTAGKAATQTSPTGATGYGNAGGTGFQNGSTFASGGGGGAGAAGSSYSGSNGGAGGAGKNTWSTWLSATNTGVSGYIAGGGGGGVYNQGTSGAGGSGGGGAGWTGAAGANPASPVTDAMHGVRGTGGGGGGAGANFAGGNGGSGIVIIRYAMV